MLILTRKCSEAVVIGDTRGFVEQLLKVTVLEIRGMQVKLGFEARGEVPIHRAEIWERIMTEDQEAKVATPIAVQPKYRLPYNG